MLIIYGYTYIHCLKALVLCVYMIIHARAHVPYVYPYVSPRAHKCASVVI